MQRQVGAEHRDRRAQQHAEGQRPAFVLRGQNQEHEQQRQTENRRGRYPLGRLRLLERHGDPVVAHFLGHGLVKDVDQGRGYLSPANTRLPAGIDLRGLVLVIAQCEFGPGDVSVRSNCAQRHRCAVRAVHVILSDVVRTRPRIAFRFHVHLPLPPEAVEIIDQETAHEGLQRLVYIADVYALAYDLDAIHIHIHLWHIRRIGCDQRREFGPLTRRGDKFIHVLGQEFLTAAGPVFEHERCATRRTDTRNSRWLKRERDCFFQLGQRPAHILLNGQILFVFRFARIPVLQRHEEKCVVCILRETQQAEPHHAGHAFHSRRFQQDVFHFPGGGVAALQRRRIGQHHSHEQITLIFVRQK